MKRVLIAGAAGYVGRNLIAALDGRAEVTCVDFAEGCVHPGQLKNLTGNYDVFFNLAWVGKGGALRADYAVQLENVRVALDFYQESLRLGCRRYICAGTIGELMVELPACAHVRSQNFVYVNAKNFLRRTLHAIEDPARCKVVWARIGNLYGSGDSGGNLIAYTIDRILAGEKAVFGPAEQPYDFVHATDCACALAELGMAESMESSVFYIGSGDVRPLKEYLREVGALAGKPELIAIGGRPDDGTRYLKEWFSIDDLTRETGYRPRIAFSEGVKSLLGERTR